MNLDNVQIARLSTKVSLLDISPRLFGDTYKIRFQIVEFNADTNGKIRGSKAKATSFMNLDEAMLLAKDIVNLRFDGWEQSGDSYNFRRFGGGKLASEISIKYETGKFLLAIREGEAERTKTGATKMVNETSRAMNMAAIQDARRGFQSLIDFIEAVNAYEFQQGTYRRWILKEGMG